MDTMINFGDKVKDRVTGLTGIVVARTEWLNGCIRVTVQPQELKDGQPVLNTTLDIEDWILVEAGVVAPKAEENRTNGPMPGPGAR